MHCALRGRRRHFPDAQRNDWRPVQRADALCNERTPWATNDPLGNPECPVRSLEARCNQRRITRVANVAFQTLSFRSVSNFTFIKISEEINIKKRSSPLTGISVIEFLMEVCPAHSRHAVRCTGRPAIAQCGEEAPNALARCPGRPSVALCVNSTPRASGVSLPVRRAAALCDDTCPGRSATAMSVQLGRSASTYQKHFFPAK